MSIPHSLLKGLQSFSLGTSGLRFFTDSEFAEGQRGYSNNPEGAPLVSSEVGGWEAGWTVIGYEESCGDPIFIDVNANGFPVFTAMHGMGTWAPKRIADTLESLRQIIDEFAKLSVGRENPVSLEANPISNSLRNEVLEKVRRLSPSADLEFWELTMGFYGI